jgi:hypothetical protein
MYIVKNGSAEIFIKVDDEYLCIERLYRGSILNHNAFLMADKSDVKITCSN